MAIVRAVVSKDSSRYVKVHGVPTWCWKCSGVTVHSGRTGYEGTVTDSVKCRQCGTIRRVPHKIQHDDVEAPRIEEKEVHGQLVKVRVYPPWHTDDSMQDIRVANYNRDAVAGHQSLHVNQLPMERVALPEGWTGRSDR